MKTEFAQKMPGLQDPSSGNPQRAWQRRANPLCIALLHLAPESREPEPWHIPNDDKSAINLEHILPEKPEGNWPQFTDEQVKLYYKRIGNLCLMRASDNSAAKSAGFATKKPIFAKSPYLLTKQIADAAEWGWEQIVERQKSLAKVAVKTWPI